MFKKLKQKIQEETGAPPDGAFSSHGGPGLASPVSKDAPGGGLLGVIKDSPMRDGRRDSIDSTASTEGSSRSKEEVLALLVKRTDQVKRLESKVSDLAAMIKEKNRQVERLEGSLEKAEEASAQKVQDLNEQYQSSQSANLGKKEEEFRARIERLEKTNEELKSKLRQAEEYRDKYFKLAEEDDELQGLNTQELAKVKHMLLNTQEELARQRAEVEEKTEKLDASEKQVKQLENEVMQLAEKISKQKQESEKMAVEFNEEKKKSEQFFTERGSLKTQLDAVNLQLSQKSSQLNALQTSYHQLQDEHMMSQRNSDLHRQKTSSMIEEKDDQISQLKERVETLDQRVEDSTLSGDERLTAMELERTAMEMRLQEARQQLTEVKTTWSDKITHLEKQISNLNQKIAEDAEDLASKERELKELRAAKDQEVASAQAAGSEQTERTERELNAKLKKLELEMKSMKKETARNLELIQSKDDLLQEQKKAHETEARKQKQTVADRELELQDSIRDLEAKIISLEKAREKDRQTFQGKLTTLESSQDEWLEKEIDVERQITGLEEELQEVRTESSHRERDNARLTQQLTDRLTELNALKEKVSGQQRSVQTSQGTVDQLRKDLQVLGTDFQSVTKEKDNLLIRNAELFQKLEAHKRDISESDDSYRVELQGKETAIAGLEQSLQDLTTELNTQKQRATQLEAEAKSAKQEYESEEATRLKKEVSGLEDQIADRNKTIKIQQQRLVDLKKTLQRELKVQTLPNDEPMDTNNRDMDFSLMSNKSNAKGFPRNMSNNTLFGGNGGLRPGTKVPVAAERTMQVMTRCAAGNDCLCEHVNFEYLKHVLIKFMTSREHEAVHLIRAVAVLLHLSLDEQRVIRDTLEWKMSWGFASRPKVGKGQMAKVIPPSY